MVRSIEDEVIKMRAELEEADDKALRARNVGDRDKWILWLRESQQLREKMLQLMEEQVAAQPGNQSVTFPCAVLDIPTALYRVTGMYGTSCRF